MSLRLIPDFYAMRPADPVESEACFRAALNLKAPSAICLIRQKVPYIAADRSQVHDGAMRGAWVVNPDVDDYDAIIFASGSEVSLALAVAEKIANQAVGKIKAARVVSVPCWELFFAQDADYQDEVMSRQTQCRISIEAGSTLGWEKWVGSDGLKIGLDQFAASAPYQKLEEVYGFTPDAVYARIAEEFGA